MQRLTAIVLVWFGLWPAAIAAQESFPGLELAFKAVQSDDWESAYAIAGTAGPVARDVIVWTRLREGEGEFDEYRRFLARRGNWPGLDRLRAHGERSLTPDGAPQTVLDFFANRDPLSGEGAVAYARALRATGQAGLADATLVEVWRTYGLDESGHAAMIQAAPALLAPHHTARADMLLWRWKTEAAALMLPLLGPDQRQLTEARIALIDNSGDRQAKLQAVPAALRTTPGLLYDRYNWLANQGARSQAIEILQSQSRSADTLQHPFRWAGWRRALARWKMREGDTRTAYDLASNHHLTDGSAYSDLEWLAGYIALTYLERPTIALQHFIAMRGNVSSPISVGRAEYWIARSHAQLGDAGNANAAYTRAAQHQTSFYGLLAAERIGLPLTPDLAAPAQYPDWRYSDIMTNELVQAGLMLLSAGERGKAVLFFAQLGRELPREQIMALGGLLGDMDEVYFQVLLGKAAAERGMILPELYFPTHPLTALDLPVEDALALSIARRESEFRADAGSPVGALGLMQLMPATAQEVAGSLDLPYRRGQLTADWQYNATLGSQYLANLIEEFGDTPVMVAAGYNAGPSRPRQWMDLRGDPRLNEVDVVDWIEHIPFRETRNYVMRVTESIPVYRARLTNRGGQVDFTALLTGTKPILRPRARPVASAPDDTSQNATELAPTRSLRPQARTN